MALERIPGPAGASFSAGVTAQGHGRFIHVSGQFAPGSDLAEQATGCFDRIEAILAQAGASLRDVVSIRAYLTSLDSYADYARVRRERFGDGLPASAADQVAGLLEGALVEVEAVAFVATD